VVVEAGELAERFAAEAPSVVASEAGITEAAVTSMEAATGGRASTLDWAGVIRIIGVTRIMDTLTIGAIRITMDTRITPPTIRTRMALLITRRHRLPNRHRVKVNLRPRNPHPRNSLRMIRHRLAVRIWDRGDLDLRGH